MFLRAANVHGRSGGCEKSNIVRVLLFSVEKKNKDSLFKSNRGEKLLITALYMRSDWIYGLFSHEKMFGVISKALTFQTPHLYFTACDFQKKVRGYFNGLSFTVTGPNQTKFSASLLANRKPGIPPRRVY